MDSRQSRIKARSAEQTDASHAADQELARLRSLLLMPEQTEIRQLRGRIEDRSIRASDVGEVLADAVQGANTRSAELSFALAPLIEEALRETIRRNPKALAEALFPLLGPAIRQAVARGLRSLIDSLNRIIEQSFTWRGVRWRWEAFRTRRPLAEIALRHSLVYRVEQIFLIHRETGVLLQNAGMEEVARDEQLVSAMLTAIQDFVRDSFAGGEDQELEALEVGEFQVWIERRPQTLLAAVIRGNPPYSLHERLGDTLAAIELQVGDRLRRFDGEVGPFLQTRLQLEGCLEQQWIRSQRGLWPSTLVFVTILALLMAAAGVAYWRSEQRWRSFLRTLAAEPGIAVLESGGWGRQRRVSILRDPSAPPLAELLGASGFDSQRIQLKSHSFVSTEPAIVEKRAREALAPPEGVALRFADGVLRAAGVAPTAWIAALDDLGPRIAGVATVDRAGLESLEATELRRLVREAETIRIQFDVGSTRLRPEDRAKIESTARVLQRIFELGDRGDRPVAAYVLGQTDPTGSERINARLRRRRAAVLRDALVQAGAPAGRLALRAAPRRGSDDLAALRRAWVEVDISEGAR